MQSVNVVVLVYALLTIGLGIDGYVAKGSWQSALAGGVAGLLLLGSLALAKTNPRAGRIGAAVITLLLLIRFLGPFIKTQDWMPAGVMTIASAITLAVLVGGHLLAMSRRKAQA
jgi:uncharacterized membrane protein (UPF0136 family)